MPSLLHNIERKIHKLKRMVTRPDPARIKRINFSITNRCNSRCKSCSIWEKYKGDSTRPDEELSLGQIKDFFEGSHALKSLDEITLTGGEPFLRQDFRDLYRYLRESFPKTSIVINTNGLLVKDTWIDTKEDSLWTILVFSLDGLEKTNDLIRGVKGSFQKALAAVNHYKELFPDLKVGLSFTLFPENHHELKEVYHLSRNLDVFFTMRFAAESKTYYGNSGVEVNWSDEQLNHVEADVNWIVQDISGSRSFPERKFNPDLFFFSKMVQYQRNKKRLFQCHSGVHSLFIDPLGNIYACIFSEIPLGNIKNKKFDGLWFSEQAEKQRVAIAKESCHCWTECETIPSLQRSLNYSG